MDAELFATMDKSEHRHIFHDLNQIRNDDSKKHGRTKILRNSDWSQSDRLANFVVALQEVTVPLCAQAEQRGQNAIHRLIYPSIGRPIRSRRLLCLSNRIAAGICATQHTFPVVKCPPYIALSYT